MTGVPPFPCYFKVVTESYQMRRHTIQALVLHVLHATSKYVYTSE
jgi:hypothetical protein